MNNLILEMKKIVDEARDNKLSNDLTRNLLKEYLHYFVLDFIYNSEFKKLVFYGGSCLRIIYELNRMSEDLDFEGDEKIDFQEIAESLESYFKKDLSFKEKFSVGKQRGINRIFLKLPVIYQLGLSPHKDEVLRIKIEIRPMPKGYFKQLKPVFTPKSRYGRSFVVQHYDLPTLFASKLAAILSRPGQGFSVGRPENGINFKGRDFYDLIWYMEKGILPDKEMLKANKLNKSIGEILEEIEGFIMSRKNLSLGLKKDLGPLFVSQNFVNNFAENFKSIFQRLKKEKYEGVNL